MLAPCRLRDTTQPVGFADTAVPPAPDQEVVKDSSRRELLVPVASGTMVSWKAHPMEMLQGRG